MSRRQQKVAHCCEKFCNQTSLHGWQYLSTEPSLWQKLTWFLAILSVTALAIILNVNNVMDFLNMTPVTDIKNTNAPLKDLTFPMITIHNFNQIPRSELKKFQMGIYTPKHLRAFMAEYLHGSNSPSKYLDKIQQEMKEAYPEMNEKTQLHELMKQKCEDFIIFSEWKSTYIKVMEPVTVDITDWGYSCSIIPYLDYEHQGEFTASDAIKIQKGGGRSGASLGLRMLIDVEAYEYSDFNFGSTGIKVGFGDATEKPTFTRDGLYAQPGTESILAMIPTQVHTTEAAIKRFTPTQRNCYTDEELNLTHFTEDLGFAYSLNNCIYEAALQATLEKCKCHPYYFYYGKTNLKACRGSSLQCAKEVLRNNSKVITTRENTEMECMDSCTRIEYESDYSSALYPNQNTFFNRMDVCFVLKKVAKVCQTNSYAILQNMKEWAQVEIECEEVLKAHVDEGICLNSTHVSKSQRDMHKDLFKGLFYYARDNIIHLKVYFKDPYYTIITRDVGTTLISFIGNVGGLLGLCLGLSFLSVFEIIYHFVNACFIK